MKLFRANKKSTTRHKINTKSTTYVNIVIFIYFSFAHIGIIATFGNIIQSICIMNKYLLAIITLSFLGACHQSEKNKSDLFEVDVVSGINNKVAKLLLSDAVSDIDIIPLETNDSCFIQRIRKMEVGENDLFINNVSQAYSRVFRFDLTGKFLNIVARTGEGPQEIMMPDGLGIDDNKKLIHIANSFGFVNEIKTYRYDGSWQGTIKAAKPGAALFGTFNWDQRPYYFFNGKHIIRRFLPLQDGTSDLWQIGILNQEGKYIARLYDPNMQQQQKEIDANNSGQHIDKIRYAWGTESPVLNRYRDAVNFMFESNDTIYRYNEKENTLHPYYILNCGERPTPETIYKLGKSSDYFKYIFAVDLLEAKDYLYVDVEKDKSAFLLQVDKKSGNIQSLELEGEMVDGALTKYRKVDAPEFTNDLCGGPTFYPSSHNDRKWICAYNASDLLEIDIEKLKKTDVLFPEKRNQLVKILENLKDDDNPVIMVATLK